MRKVLIVEDKDINRTVLRNILKGEYEVLEAVDGREALMVLNKKHKVISAVLLDIVMPVMDGFEVLAAMRSNAVLAQIPVIVTTGAEDASTEVRALALGANDFVAKPYNPVLILHSLRNTINLRETASIVNAIQRDRLTGLYNRETFFDKASSMLGEKPAGYYVMASFDVDGFKIINDQFGATEGDRILQHIGKVAKAGFESIGGICSRISADNFAALYPAGEDEVDFISNMREEKLLPHDARITITLSVGRYIVTDLTLPVSAVYDRAFIAKQSVKGRYDEHVAYFSESMRDKLLHEQRIISEMDEALAGQQFETWLQPQFNHTTGALVGAEALVRWRHPDRGLIAPDSFIPVFERNGFIYELDKYVWEQVCDLLRKWLDEGRKPLPVAVNISRYDIFCKDFFKTITGLIKRYRLPVDLLRLEITESAFAQSTDKIIAIVRQLVEYGFIVEIDDFGSGYSSLNTLKDVPATVLKLDMKFMETTGDMQRGGNIVESVVRMAKWLGMVVIAEGVETIEQADYLKSIGCNYVQGYLYARPMPVEDYETLAGKAEKEESLPVLQTVENLDNNAFWDPSSMDTLIFNSYVGGACIFEYYNGTIELLRANDAYAKVLDSAGMTVEDALKLKWSEHMDAECRRAMQAALQESVKSGGSVTGEYVFRDLPGCPAETCLRSTIRVIASSGDHYLVYCMNENITAQRQAEKKEHETAEHLQVIMNNINGGVTAAIVQDGSPYILFANEQYFKQLGYTRPQYEEEVKKPYDPVHADDRARVAAQTEKASRTQEPFSVIYRIVRRDGSVRWIQSNISITTFADVDGPVQLAVANDITELREAEEKEHRASEQLKAIMDDAGSGITATTLEDGAIRFLLANDRFYEIVGYTRAQYDAEVRSIFDLIHSDDRARVQQAATKAYKEETSAQLEYRIIWRDKSEHWLRAILSSTHFTGIRQAVQLCVLTDISAEKANEKTIQETDEQLHFLNEMAHDLLAQPDSDKAITDMLERLLSYFDGKRAYIFEFDYTNATFSNSFEVCAEGVTHEKDNLQGLSLDLADIWLRSFEERNYIDIADVDALSEGRADKQTLQAQGIRSLIAVPLRRDGALIGVVGIDDPGRSHALIDRLVALGDYIAVSLTRRDLEAKILRDNEMAHELMNDMPGGFARIRVSADGKICVPVYLNDGFCKLVGMDRSALMDMYGEDAMAGVHPDDISIVQRAVECMLTEGEAHSAKYRLRSGDGGYVWTMIYGRATEGEDGERFLNIYYIEMTDTEAAYSAMLPVALSAVISASPEMSFVKDAQHRYVCCSPLFVVEAGQKDAADIVGKTDYDLVDKSFADRYYAEDAEIFASGQALLDYEAPIPSFNDTLRYASTSKYPLLDADGSVIGIYGVTRDMTKAREADSQLRLLTDSIPGGLATYACSKDGVRLVYFNDGFCRLFGYAREEYAEKSAREPVTMVFDEDRAMLDAQLERLMRDDTPMSCVYRAHVHGGGYRWISHRAVAADRRGETVIVNAVLFDVTELQETAERLRIAEEEHRLALQHSNSVICRFTVADRTAVMAPEVAAKLDLPATQSDVPWGPVKRGDISADTVDAFAAFYEGILKGSKSGAATFKQKTKEGWRWLEGQYSTIFSTAGEPITAVISFRDVTETLEKEAVYKKWHQSLMDKDPACYTLFRCNLSKDASFDTMEGLLLKVRFDQSATGFNDRTREYVEQCVFEEDCERYAAVLNSDSLLANYYRGKRSEVFEYREKCPDGGVRWLRLTIDLIEYPNSTDIEAYLLYENIDDSKRAELLTLERAEKDPLTGVLNRSAFVARLEQMIHTSKVGAKYALLMLDIDGFKLVNDAFGHGAGDQTLIDAAAAMRTALRRGDLLGRLGGDEFVVFLNDIPSDSVAVNKARQIRSLIRKSFSVEVQISASIGIAMYPRDGKDFDALYKRADAALYHVKGVGKDNYAFYNEEMEDECLPMDMLGAAARPGAHAKKRRMLIVDDSRIDCELLNNIFHNDFIIEKARDGASALIRLRHYGSAISVVLLDLIMPGMDGFKVLEKMQSSAELQAIPVVVVSAAEEREMNLKAIRSGASDYVTKPVDADILRIRVQSAISKAENERLRAQNSFLELESNELTKYRTVLEHTGIVLIEHDWLKGTFNYDPSLNAHVAGNWDDRGLWRILLADEVASASDVKAMQTLVRTVAEDRDRHEGGMTVMLKTPEGQQRRFRMDIYKQVNEHHLTDRFIIAFRSVDGGSEVTG